MKKVLLLLCCIILLSLGTGCSEKELLDVDDQIINAETADFFEEVGLIADWPSYENLSELVAQSENIVIGYVNQKLPYIELDISNGQGRMDTFTPFEVSVSQSLKGSINANESITIIQKGGMTPDGKVFYFIENMPLLEVGKTYLLYLTDSDKDGNYGLYPPSVGYIAIEDQVLKFRDDQVNLFDEQNVSIANASKSIMNVGSDLLIK